VITVADVDVLEYCRAVGVALREDGGRLRVRGPEDVVTEELLDLLREHKAEILAALADAGPAAPAPLPWRAAVAAWPIALRQRWADRAEAHQAAGLGWREAESRAFDEVVAETGAPIDPAGAPPEPDSLDPDELAAVLVAIDAACVPPREGPTLPPRPGAAPTYGLTARGRVIELGRARSDREERSDPVRRVTGEGWPDWYPADAPTTTAADAADTDRPRRGAEPDLFAAIDRKDSHGER
jgi:hypothetical protein